MCRPIGQFTCLEVRQVAPQCNNNSFDHVQIFAWLWQSGTFPNNICYLLTFSIFKRSILSLVHNNYTSNKASNSLSVQVHEIAKYIIIHMNVCFCSIYPFLIFLFPIDFLQNKLLKFQLFYIIPLCVDNFLFSHMDKDMNYVHLYA